MPEDSNVKPVASPAQAQPPADSETAKMLKSADGKPLMEVKVYAPFKIYFEGEAFSLTAENETGPFDILPHHHNFLCMLVPCDLVIKAPSGDRTIKISRALMHVKAEKVTIYVDV